MSKIKRVLNQISEKNRDFDNYDKPEVDELIVMVDKVDSEVFEQALKQGKFPKYTDRKTEIGDGGQTQFVYIWKYPHSQSQEIYELEKQLKSYLAKVTVPILNHVDIAKLVG